MDKYDRYHWQKAWAAIFYPQRSCLRCGALSIGTPLCSDCQKEMDALRACPVCATFVRHEETEAYRCANCRGEKPPFRLARAALPYEGELREKLLAFKYHDRTGLRRPLAALLRMRYAQAYQDAAFDLLLPIPLPVDRLAERGYNQAELLSDLLGKELRLPHEPSLLQRKKATQPLALLSKRERERALNGAFLAAPEVSGRKILLIDDIYTTGATASAAGRALLQKGAQDVCVLTVAAGRDL